MAIQIPSSKIYKKENPKVRDNVIDRIEVSAKEVVPNNEYDTTIFNENNSDILKTDEDISNKTIDTYAITVPQEGINGGLVAYAKYDDHKFFSKTIYIPVVSKNKYVSNVKVGVDDNGLPNIKWTLFGTLTEYDTSANWEGTVEWSSLDGYVLNITEGDISLYNAVVTENINLQIPKTIEASIISGSVSSISLKVTEKLKDGVDWGAVTAERVQENGVEYFKIDIKLLCGVTSYTLVGQQYEGLEAMFYPLSGKAYKYDANQVEITIYGDTIGIDLNDKTLYVPSESGNKPFSIDGNELMQTSNQGKTLLEAFTNTQRAYSNGKETATIRCSISDYYLDDEAKTLWISPNQESFVPNFVVDKKNGDGSVLLVFTIDKPYPFDINVGANISTFDYNYVEKNYDVTGVIVAGSTEYSKELDDTSDIDSVNINTKLQTNSEKSYPMCFQIYDEVLPMVYGADGNDRPMSKKQDGTAKTFKVLGTKIYFDGAVWQELFLQET